MVSLFQKISDSQKQEYESGQHHISNILLCQIQFALKPFSVAPNNGIPIGFFSCGY